MQSPFLCRFFKLCKTFPADSQRHKVRQRTVRQNRRRFSPAAAAFLARHAAAQKYHEINISHIICHKNLPTGSDAAVSPSIFAGMFTLSIVSAVHVQAVCGFGYGTISTSFFPYLLPYLKAVALSGLSSSAASLIVALCSWRHTNWKCWFRAKSAV